MYSVICLFSACLQHIPSQQVSAAGFSVSSLHLQEMLSITLKNESQ